MTHPLFLPTIRQLMKVTVAHVVPGWELLPRPVGVDGARASGPTAMRILLIGGGPAVGFGVLSHDLALPGNIARSIWTMSGRGADVDVIAHPTMTAHQLVSELESVELPRYDAVLLVPGAYDSMLLSPVHAFGQDVAAVLAYLEREGHPALSVVVARVPSVVALGVLAGLPGRIAARHAVVLNAELDRVCARSSNVELVTLRDTDPSTEDRHRSPDTFRVWARQLVEPIAGRFAEEISRPDAGERQDEQKRQESLERLRIIDTEPDARFDRIAILAQQTFGTTAAALTFVDGERQWFKARSGFDIDETPRSDAFCDFTIRQSAAFIVPDTTSDPRFANNRLVTGLDHVRSYAGYPIETPDGHRVGAFCVIDKQPRTFSEGDVVLLRNLALMVQDEIWADQKAQSLR